MRYPVTLVLLTANLGFHENFPHFASSSSISSSFYNTDANEDASLILGGLFPIHEKGNKKLGQACGRIMERRGIQRAAAMLYAIDQINRNNSILPGIKLGALIIDTCADPIYALNQSLSFVRNLMGTSFLHGTCADASAPVPIVQRRPIAGVIGEAYSDVTIQTANLLKLFDVVQVSPASTSADLSDKQKFYYFARTVPPDNYQAKALAEVAHQFNWSYVSVVYSAGEYGEFGAEEFKKAARNLNICVAAEEKVSQAADIESALLNLRKMAEKSSGGGARDVGARVVVLFTRNDDTRRLLQAAKSAKSTWWSSMNLFWLAADGWEMSRETTSGLEDVALGALTTVMTSTRIPRFERFFRSLHPTNDEAEQLQLEHNFRPFFEEFWEQRFNCVLRPRQRLKPLASAQELPDALSVHNVDAPMSRRVDVQSDQSNADVSTSHRVDVRSLQHVDGPSSQSHSTDVSSVLLVDGSEQKRVDVTSVVNRSSGSTNNTSKRVFCATHRQSLFPVEDFDEKVEFVIDAVYAMAIALHNMWLNICKPHGEHSYRGLCSEMDTYNRELFGKIYFSYLLNVSFTGSSGKVFQFDKHGDGPAVYKIMNYQYDSITNQMVYVTVGRWEQGRLVLDQRRVWFNLVSQEPPISRCSGECPLGHVKKTQAGDTCCWVCVPCQNNQIVKHGKWCRRCIKGYWPDEKRRRCIRLADHRLQQMQWDSIYSIIPCCISVAGIVLTMLVVRTYIAYSDTPVIRASGRELSHLLLLGILICYAMTFLVLQTPSAWTCGAKRIGIGLGFSVLYSSLLVKTNRIYRIFDAARRGRSKVLFISPVSQVVLAGSLVSVQLLGSAAWLLLNPPAAHLKYPDPQPQVVLKCKVEDNWFLLSLVYNVVLIGVCTVYAVKTRNVPENYNETKYIGFTMYTTCIIWLGFVPIFFGTGENFRIHTAALCVAVSLSATVALLCLFSPKIYVIYFEPEKNVRKGIASQFILSTTAAFSASPYAPLIPKLSMAGYQLEQLQYGAATATGATDTTTSTSNSASQPMLLPNNYRAVGQKKSIQNLAKCNSKTQKPQPPKEAAKTDGTKAIRRDRNSNSLNSCSSNKSSSSVKSSFG